MPATSRAHRSASIIRPRIGVATDDRLADLLAASRHDDSRALGRFLRERIATLAGASAPP